MRQRNTIARFIATFALAAFLSAAGASTQVAPSDTVAAVLIAEAGGEGESGMRAVMEVIQNRAGRKHSFESVVLKPKQFSCLNGTTAQALIAKAKKHKRWALAVKISRGTGTNLTRGANHYHAGATPYWAKGETPTAVIGGHTFFKL